MADAGLSSAQLPILRAVAKQPWLPLNQLAKLLYMERTSLYRTLAPMIEADWIMARGSQPGEGRNKSVALTRKGRTTITAANVHWKAIQSRMVESFGAKRWESLHRDIAELAALGVALGQ